MRWLVALLVLALSLETAMASEWRQYSDPAFGYSLVVPDNGFEIEADPSRNGLTIYERDGSAQIDVYAIRNEDGRSLQELKSALSKAERIKRITYSRAGTSWFVISGYYKGPKGADADLIFYAKFIMSTDRRSIAAFEASYPIAEKRRFDAVIERIEDSFTRPR